LIIFSTICYILGYFFLKYSLGTFGFWTAYLKEKGDVIFVTGTSAYPTYTEPSIREHLQNWKLLEDPCYEKNSEGDMSLKEDCAGLD
jgi:hypothetical protein